MNKKTRSKTSKESVMFLWKKGNTENIPNSRTRNQKHNRIRKPVLNQHSPELQEKQRFCSQAETKTTDITQPTRSNQNKRNKAKKTKMKNNKQIDKEGLGSSEVAPPHLTLNLPEKRKTGRFRVKWGGPSGLTSPYTFQKRKPKT